MANITTNTTKYDQREPPQRAHHPLNQNKQLNTCGYRAHDKRIKYICVHAAAAAGWYKLRISSPFAIFHSSILCVYPHHERAIHKYIYIVYIAHILCICIYTDCVYTMLDRIMCVRVAHMGILTTAHIHLYKS